MNPKAMAALPVLLVLVACTPPPPPTWDDVASGACADCLHERIDLSRPDRIVIDRVASIDISTRGDLKRARDRQWIQMRSTSGPSNIVSARFIGVDGDARSPDEEALATWSACQQARWDNTRPPAGQTPLCAMLPIEVKGDGMLVVHVRQDVRSLLPGGHRARFVPRVLPRRVGVSIVGADPASLHTRGEFRFDEQAGALVHVGGLASEVGVSTVGSWAPIARDYAAAELEAMGPVEVQLAADGGTAPEQALREAAAWIIANLRYSGDRTGFGEAVYPNTFAETVDSGEGDCKEFAMVLRRLLAERGIESESVLVKLDSTEIPDRGLPSPADFDHVVVYIPALDRYVDPTRRRIEHMLGDARDRFAYAIHTSDGRVVELR